MTRPTSVRQRKVVAWLIVGLSVALIPACLTVATMEAIEPNGHGHANASAAASFGA